MRKYISIIVMTISLCACDSITKMEPVQFNQLPIYVQDSLVNIVNHITIGDLRDLSIKDGVEELIDFTREYKSEVMMIGPWVDKYKITNKMTGNYFYLPQDTPHPFIIVDRDVYIPREYNIVYMGINDTTMFDHYEIR